jgi:hypothetical protein
MNVGDLVKRIKHQRVGRAQPLLGVVIECRTFGVRVFYFEVGNDYWEDRDWLERLHPRQ